MASDRIRVLLVESNPDDAASIRKMLAGLKDPAVELTWEESLSAATARIDSEKIDLVLLDLTLPDSTGLETLRKLNVAAPGMAVVVLSQSSNEDIALETLQEGAQDYLIKGKIDADSLTRSVRYAIGRNEIRAALRRARADLEVHVRERTSQLLKTNRALRKSERLLQSVLNNLTTLVFAKDPKGRYILINPAFERLFERKKEDIIGKTDYDLFPTESAEAFRSADERVLRECNVVEMEELVPGVDSTRTFLTIKAPLCDEIGRPYAVIGIAADVTERKLLEEQLRHSQKMDAVGRLAGGIAHDFNNLLSIIVGYSELLRTSLAADPVKLEQMTQISKAADQAAVLTRKLLTFSRDRMTKQKLLDLNTVLLDLRTMLKSVVGENVELEIRTESKPSLVHSERDQVEQAILNLVLNARDAMRDGGKITVSVERFTANEEFARLNPPLRPGPYVCLTVADTGCGMDAETRAHIFEPFFTTKELGKGTGLGLATVYGTVRQSGGGVVVESEPGKGSSFFIYLPRVKGSLAREASEPSVPPEHGTETILVAEDEDRIRNLVSDVLQLNGYTVLSARDGREALATAESHQGPIQLLITDLVMPQMGGRELAESIRPLRPETRVLFISGYSDRKTTSLPEGADFLDKPFSPETLVRKLRQLLDAPKLRSIRA